MTKYLGGIGCLFVLGALACDGATVESPRCGPALGESIELIDCLARTSFLSHADAEISSELLREARYVADSLRADSAYSGYENAGLIVASVRQLEHLYDTGQLTDSVRFNRMVDHVAVTVEWVRGALRPDDWGLVYPHRTPRLAWVFTAGSGIYFEPALTVERHQGFVPGATQLSAGATELGEALWRYRRSIGSPPEDLAIWESMSSSWECLESVSAPRASAESQGAVLSLYAALYASSGDEQWKARGGAVVRSFATPQHGGGVREGDVKDGYSFHIGSASGLSWREQAIAVVALLEFSAATGDPTATEVAQEGLRRARQLAQEIDTGAWTRRCLAGGFSDIDTHRLHVALARALFEQTADPHWSATAARWEDYSNPSALRSAR